MSGALWNRIVLRNPNCSAVSKTTKLSSCVDHAVIDQCGDLEVIRLLELNRGVMTRILHLVDASFLTYITITDCLAGWVSYRDPTDHTSDCCSCLQVLTRVNHVLVLGVNERDIADTTSLLAKICDWDVDLEVLS